MRFGISEKIIFLFVLLIIVLSAAIGFYFINYQSRTLLAEFDERAKALTQSLVVSVEYPVLVEDKDTLELIGKGMLQQKNVVFCEIRDRENKVLFQRGLRPQENVRQYTVPVLTQKTTVSPGEELLLGPAEKQFEKIGTAHLHFSLAGLKDKVNAVKKTIVQFVLVGIALAFLFISLFVRLVLGRPVGKLVGGIKKISAGDLNYKVPIRTKDEIGMLAVSFNQMTDKLRASYTHLEDKVQERTSELSLANTKLEEEITERSLAQRRLQRHIKQLNCFYGLSKLLEKPQVTLEQIFQETVSLIRGAYQYPDETSVRITFDGSEYKTYSFEKSEFGQYAQITVHGEKAGVIEVYYIGKRPQADDDGPFLNQERELLDAVAERLGRITELNRTGERLRLFRGLIDRSNDCIFVIEPENGCFLDVNDRACITLGYSREELLQMTLRDIEEPVLDYSLWQQLIKDLKLKGDVTVQGRHRHKNRTTFFVETTLKLVTQEKKDYIIAIARDITERKEAEMELSRTKERLQYLLTTSPAIIYTSQPYGHYPTTYISENVLERFGYTEEEFLSDPNFWFDHIHPDDREKVIADLQNIAEKDHYSHEYRFLHKDGNYLWVFDELNVVRDEKGRIVEIIGSRIDITDRKEAERIKARLLEELESANKELTNFAYVVSHDLKAPLRGIGTLAEWISSDYAGKLGKDGKEQMNLLLTRVARMHDLIEGVLQYSRAGRIKEQRVEVDLNELIPEVIDMVAPPENVEITIEDRLPVIECEQTRIIQVFENLLSNAVKYMDKPQSRIRIGCVEEDAFWKFSVADNGPGIEEKHFERVFQMFQTLSPREEFESTGVGLTVVKKIVELYGGNIWLESKLGEGSTFFFTLPKAVEDREVSMVVEAGEVRYES